MNCMRCGRETSENEIFCDECLQDMQRHPVDPTTPVILPNREKRIPSKRTNFRVAASKWEDRIFRLRYLIFWLVMIILLLLIALGICICSILGVLPNWLNDLLALSKLKEDVLSLIN